MLQTDAMPREQRLQHRAARKEALTCLAICGLAQILAARIAENGGEKHGGVLAIGFEQKDVGVGVLRPLSVHADFHPSMNDRTKGLREDQSRSRSEWVPAPTINAHPPTRNNAPT